MSRPRIAVTGPEGFVAWHVRCAARARWSGDLIHVEAEFADPGVMDAALAGADAVIHLAGVNRAHDPAEIERVNPWLAEQLVASMQRTGRSIPVVYGNSIHSLGDSPFGEAKRRAADILRDGAPLVDVVMPNIFGEHGRPNYNSVVATFCHAVAAGETPVVVDDKELPLVHVGRIADVLLDQAAHPQPGTVEVPGRPTWVSEVAQRLTDIAADYRTGRLPDLSDPFTKELFNTYRSAAFPGQYPIRPVPSDDQRGRLVEAVKGAGGQAQVFYSTTNPGFTRGQHWHRHKVERFLVLAGQGEIRLRKLFTDEVVAFEVSGAEPAIVDMPTFWVHSITNTGSQPLVTLFFADEIYDANSPDTYPEDV
ncbi:MAG: capsular biosynthesis protein [Micrococcales bacterium]|nr:capsular biosynthesis protein [Micrococcales bacterium]